MMDRMDRARDNFLGEFASMQATMMQSQVRMRQNMARMHEEMRRHHALVHSQQLERFHGIDPMQAGLAPSPNSHVMGNWSSHAGGVATSVIDGDVYVNGEWVARVPRGRSVAVTQVDGMVQVNGEVVWAARDVRQRQKAVVNEAMRCSVASECSGDREDPCPVCLEQIRVGQTVRTLPCFHALHGHCAEAHFAAAAASLTGASARRGQSCVQCPLCRGQVGGDRGSRGGSA